MSVRASLTLFHVPHLALGAELSSDYRERTEIVAWRTFFAILGGGLAVYLAWTWFLRESAGFPNGQLDPAAYGPFGALFGALMSAVVLASALGTHHTIPRLPSAPDSSEPLSLRRLFDEMRGALSNASFRALVSGLVIFFVMRGLQEVLALHMGTYFWKLDPEALRFVSIAFAPGLLLAVPFWVIVSRRLDKGPSFVLGISIFMLSTLIPPIAKIVGFFPAHESGWYLPTLFGAAFSAAFGGGAGLVLAGSMIADVADEHELVSGRRQEGVFFAALAFGAKATSGLGNLLAGFGLEAIRFPARAEPGAVPEAQVLALGILYGPGVALLAVGSVMRLRRYRLDRVRHDEIRAALRARRDTAQPATLEEPSPLATAPLPD